MAADLHIHVFKGITIDHLKCMNSHTLGSKWFNLLYQCPLCNDDIFNPNHCSSVIEQATPNIWIGSVSWLKAGLFDAEEEYIPNTVGQINELIGEDLPVLDIPLMLKIEKAFDLENVTQYGLAKKEKVVEFLNQHKGERLFTISW